MSSDKESRQPIDILLVEDNPGDVRLMEESLKECAVRNTMHIVSDGQEAMAFLHQEGRYAQAACPDLILLDLNLPKKDGRQVLAEIKQDPDLRRIPVIILTTSTAEEDILKVYDLYANCYITKPAGIEQYFHVVKTIEDFWLTIVKLPPRAA